MDTFVIATPQAVLIRRSGSGGEVERYLSGLNPECLAIDSGDPDRIYLGTHGDGLWRSDDAGRSWERSDRGIPVNIITALAVEPNSEPGPGVVYAGTEPSTISRSDDGGETWVELPALLDLPSSGGWSFPPRPDTHHVRWLGADPNLSGRLYAAIEAGAFVWSGDRGETWHDRVPGGPYDTHTAVVHAEAPGRIYSAAGDGYFESEDGGESWRRRMEGLHHPYLVGVAVDPGDPGTVIVSAASGPYSAYRPANGDGHLYRREGRASFESSMVGIPQGAGTVASRLTTHPANPGVFYAANNHGLFRSSDQGRSWESIPTDWPGGIFEQGLNGLGVF